MNFPSNHNMAGLTPEEQARYTIDAALEGPTNRWKALETAAKTVPPVLTTKTDAENITTLIAQLQAVVARIDTAHQETKEPWLAAGRVVDDAKRMIRDDVTDTLREMNARLTAYQVAEQKRIEGERAKLRAAEIDDPEPGWTRPLDNSRRSARIRSVEGASAHLVEERVVEIVDVRLIPDRYLNRPKVRAAILAELKADARKGDEIPGIKVTAAQSSRVKV